MRDIAKLRADQRRNVREALGTDARIEAQLVKLSKTAGVKCSKTCTYAVPEAEKISDVCSWCGAALERVEPPRAVNMRELAAISGVGEAKVAISMKNAIRREYATKDKALSAEGQTFWRPTEKALLEFGQPSHVMPDPEPVEIGGGVFTPLHTGPSKTFVPGEDGEWLPATPEGRELEAGEVERLGPERQLGEGDDG